MRDCRDGSDEGGKCDSSCAAGHPCDQKCQKSPMGATCNCQDGYKLGHDKMTCEDIDECATIDNPCAQICENHIGSYACSCFAGFWLHSDKKSCKSTGPTKYYIYTSFNTIWQLNPHLSPLFSTNGSRIVGIDMNIATNMLYFTVEETDALYVYNITDGSYSAIENIGNPTLVAIDWIADNIYFVDKSVEPTIRLCHANKRICITIMKLDKRDVVKTLTIDPINRYIFVTVLKRFPFKMPESRIFIANLDGTNNQIIFKGDLHISAMACDYNREIIYYTDWESNAIWSTDYNGKEKRKIVEHEQINHPTSINLFEGSATITSMGSTMVVNCKLYSDKACHMFKLNINNPSHILTVQESRQRTNVRDLCEKKNCSAICIPKARWADCVCDYGDVVESSTICVVSVCSLMFLI